MAINLKLQISPTPSPIPVEYDVESKVQDDKRERKSPPLCNILKIFFDFTYFLLLTPFRFGESQDGTYAIKRWLPQQVGCAIMQALCSIRLVTQVRTSILLQYAHNRNPAYYFEMSVQVANLIYKMITMKRFWYNQQDYLEIMNYIRGQTWLSLINSKLCNVILLRSLFAFAVIQSVACVVIGMDFIGDLSTWSGPLWVDKLREFARFTFFAERGFDQNDVTSVSTLQPVTFWDILGIITMVLSLYGRQILGWFCDWCLFSSAMTFWITTNCFANDLHEHNNVLPNYDESYQNNSMKRGWSQIYDYFKTIQNLSQCINHAIGTHVTWYFAEAIMYYSVNLNTVLTSKNMFSRVDKALAYLQAFGILFFAADSCNKLESVKLWISYGENSKTIPNDQLHLVLHEMLEKDVGIRGSNVFTITYPFLAVFFSTIVTYFIICIQSP